MKRARRTTAYLAMLLIACLLLPVFGARAATADPTVSVTVPVSVTGADCTVAVSDAAGAAVTSARISSGQKKNIVFSVTAPYFTPVEYTLAVADPDEGQHRYDRTVYRLIIQLYDLNGEGSYVLTARVDGGSSAKPEELTFANVPSPTPATGDPGVWKKISGKPVSASDFVFVMERLDAAWPMPSGATGDRVQMTIRGAGTGEFGNITFTEAGVYEYRVTETNTGLKNYTYDTSVYIVRYTVTETDGVLHAERVFIKDGKELPSLDRALFTNVYRDSDDSPGTGDRTHLKLWTGLTVLSLVGLALLLAACFAYKRRTLQDDTQR